MSKVTVAVGSNFEETLVFDLRQITHHLCEGNGPYYVVGLYERCRHDVLRFYKWPPGTVPGKRRGAYGALTLYLARYGRGDGTIKTYNRRRKRHVGAAVHLTRSRYLKDLEIVSHSITAQGESKATMTGEILRKYMITALTKIHPLIDVSYYTRNTIQTIQKHYIVKRKSEVRAGRITAAKIISGGLAPAKGGSSGNITRYRNSLPPYITKAEITMDKMYSPRGKPQ